MSTRSLEGAVAVISGGSRGIGLELAKALATRGVTVALLAKSVADDPRIPGTIYSAAEEIEQLGGTCLPLQVDVRDEEAVSAAVLRVAGELGRIDICINNASAIDTSPSDGVGLKRFDLMLDINVRGTWLLTQACWPYLTQSELGDVLTLSPPLNLSEKWLGAHPAYTLSKYGMTMLTLGWAAERRDSTVRFNCLWPETLIDTAAVRNIVGNQDRARQPTIMADAAMMIFGSADPALSGQSFIDAEVLLRSQLDLASYGGGKSPHLDLFVDRPTSWPFGELHAVPDVPTV